MLESSRVVTHSTLERSYHCFYATWKHKVLVTKGKLDQDKPRERGVNRKKRQQKELSRETDVKGKIFEQNSTEGKLNSK